MGLTYSSTYEGGRRLLRDLKYKEYLSKVIRPGRLRVLDGGKRKTVTRPMNVLVIGSQGAGKSSLRNTMGTTNYLHMCGIWSGNFPLNNGKRTTVSYEFTEMEYYFTKDKRNKEIVMRIFEIPGDNYRGTNIRKVLRRVLNGLEEGTILCEKEEIKDVKHIHHIKNKAENKIDSIILVANLDRPLAGIKVKLDGMYDCVREVVDEMNNDGECTDIPIYCVLTHLEGNQEKVLDFSKRIAHRIFKIENYQAEALNLDQEFTNTVGVNGWFFQKEKDVAKKNVKENPRLVVPFYREDTHQTARKIVQMLFKNDPLNSLKSMKKKRKNEPFLSRNKKRKKKKKYLEEEENYSYSHSEEEEMEEEEEEIMEMLDL